ncbi:MAG: hypothetical protein Q7W45_06965 [Bacteroidota bacterium]|nr:hypothetical protein [Bacteroidota bacterium]MDP3146570.1 hypothetical protein [Bacteroidota bacterium]MDP3556788.1 hypothetical protein [Bacteroidota bacterium]
MKKFSIILFSLLCIKVFAQSPPQVINYQGVARDVSGNPIINLIGVEFKIHQGNISGPVVFNETHNVTPNTFGIFNLQIGKNNPSAFSLINWGTNDYFLEVAIDPTGGTSYVSLGSQQLVSVPYALYAKSAGNSTAYSPGSNVTFSGPANSPTINSNPSLSMAGNILSISGSGSPVTLPSSSLTASSNVTVSAIGLNSFNLNVPNYVAGNNVTIMAPTSGNNYTINAAGSTSSTPYNLLVNTPHIITAGPAASLTIIAPNLNVTGGGGVVTSNVLPNYSINIPTVVITPTPGGLSFNQNGNTSTVSVGGIPSPWTTSVSTVNLVSTTNNVGIGTNNSTAKLTVTTNIATDAILAQSAGANGILAITNSSGSTDAGVFGSNNGAGHGLRGETSSTNSLSAAVLAVNNGIGNGVIGITGSINGLINGVKGINNSNGAGVYGENLSSATSINANGVKGVTNSNAAQAAGVNGINNGNGAGVYGENTKVTTTSGNGHGVYGKSSSTDVNAYGVYGQNLGTGSGVYGISSSAAINAAGVSGKNTGSGDGVYGETSATAGFAAGVHGEGLSSTPGMMARNVTGSNFTSASGIRAITNAINSGAAGVHGENLGTGAAVKASLTSTATAGALNAALLMENGHIKSTQVNLPTVSTFTAVGGAMSGAYTLTNCTDVKGTLLAVITTSGMVNSNGFLTLTVGFNKAYTVPPTVVVSPTSDPGLFTYFVNNVGTNSFRLTIKNNTAGNISGGTQSFNFNYFVIE